jgi:hypothetical protein
MLAPAAPATAGEECAVELARVDAGVGTFVADCRWHIAPRFVTAIVGDSRRVAEASSSLIESTKLADGRVVNVHSPGWPIADRQSTLAIDKRPLPGGGLMLAYELAPSQEPLPPGRVQALRDEGRWEIRGDGNGGTKLRYESRYDPGGGLPLVLVRSTVGSSIEESLREILAAARAAEERARDSS